MYMIPDTHFKFLNMIKKTTNALIKSILLIVYAGFLSSSINAQPSIVSLQIDGAKRFQQLDGIGVNANTRSWNGDELKPAVNLLLDSMNFTIWRVIVETVEKWEVINDNDDPFTFNWVFYNQLYETPKFQKAWDMIEYLNVHGVKDYMMLNLMGRLPSWMGDSIVKPGYEDEYVELLVSFLYYAKNTRHLQIGLFGPMNEPDIRKEGPTVGAKQYAVILRKLVDRMETLGLGDIKIVVPDVAGMNNGINEYLPAIMADPVIMSKLAHVGLHSYGGYYAPASEFLKLSAYPTTSLWMTECNAWRDGLDDGKIGVYDYKYAGDCVNYLIDLIKNGASACLLWEGYDSYYEHHKPSLFSYWGILGYDPVTKTFTPRKHFYAVSQISKYLTPGSWQIGVSDTPKELPLIAFYDPVSCRITIAGINKKEAEVTLKGTLANLPLIKNLEMIYTNSSGNFLKNSEIMVTGESFQASIPSNCIFTITGIANPGQGAINYDKPEPVDWYAGDIHIHRNCGEGTSVLSETELTKMMEPNNLAVISVLADMGDGEVKDSKTDLPKVNGIDAIQSRRGRIVHWDSEWHFDPFGTTFEHKALGGHLILLGLKEAHQIWDESPYRIIEWGKSQNAIVGFCHMQYLNDSIQNALNCCIPVDYPVEAALGTIDFLAEDVWLNDAAVNAYYKLLNCGFRLGWAAGTDFPCNNSQPFGSLLTYARVKDQPMTYQHWIEGIKQGRTVVTTNGHIEFLDLKVNGKASPSDEIKLQDKGVINIEVKWTSIKELTGRIELVCNGKIVAIQEGTAKPGEPVILKTCQTIMESSWICARRMDDKGHQSHTAPVYITVKNAPVRASVEDALYFVRWIDNILVNIADGGPWKQYFTHDLDVVQKRYQHAKVIYEKIANEANKSHNP
jgi:O-glycosyl hydrolase